MNKKLICLLLAVVMLLSLVACTTQGNQETAAPTQTPTQAPTDVPTQAPTEAPTQAPTEMPTEAPTEAPTQAPAAAPTQTPTQAPTQAPTAVPTQPPTQAPTEAPTEDTYIAPSNYEEYLALSGADQTRFMDSFASVDDFIDWIKVERQKYEEAKDKTQVGGDGVIDLG